MGLLGLSLVGCGSSDSEEAVNAVGVWYDQNDNSYLKITSEHGKLYNYSDSYACYGHADFIITDMSGHSFTVDNHNSWTIRVDHTNRYIKLEYRFSDTGDLILHLNDETDDEETYKAIDTSELPQGDATGYGRSMIDIISASVRITD